MKAAVTSASGSPVCINLKQGKRKDVWNATSSSRSFIIGSLPIMFSVHATILVGALPLGLKDYFAYLQPCGT